jgi:hypothetical protein
MTPEVQKKGLELPHVTPALEDVIGLLNLIQRQEVSVGDFCQRFEHMWNFGLDKEALSDKEYQSLDALFDEVVWFSPAPRAQWEYPKYRDEAEIRVAVASTIRSFELPNA